MLKIPPELDFTSEQFDPALALAAKDRICLPYPKAKVYNNLADWYFHTFKKKKNDILSNQESKTASRNNVYVLKRNYEWYYDTLGLDLPDDFDIQSRNKKYTKRKRNPNGKYQIDKRMVVKEMPSEMLEPMRSRKILIKRCDGSLRGFALVGTDPTSAENLLKYKNSNTKEVNSTSVPRPNRRSKLSEDSIGKSANFSETEIPHNNTVSINEECCISSEKSDSPSMTNYSSNTLSESIEKSGKDGVKDNSKSADSRPTNKESISVKEIISESPDACDKENKHTKSLCACVLVSSYSKGSTKEIALLELARRARKRLHVQ